MDEENVLASIKMRVLDMSSEPPLPFTTDNICMVSPDQQLSCMTYDLWQTIQDVLDDGEHAEFARFCYDADPHPLTNLDVYGELWTGDWWKEQQAELGNDAMILALIFYADETNVTFNGRNMHPVYVSLGNLHVEYR